MLERVRAIKAFSARLCPAQQGVFDAKFDALRGPGSVPARQHKMAKGARFQYHGRLGAAPPAQALHGPARVVTLPS
jgi:hypothetical protein